MDATDVACNICLQPCLVLHHTPRARARAQVERNLVDAMGVARNICLDPRLVPGGGVCEMAVSRGLADKATSLQGVESWPYKAVSVCAGGGQARVWCYVAGS